MIFCPKCGYERQPKDDDFIPKNECPRCGIVYEKFAERQRKLNESEKIAFERKDRTKTPFARDMAILCIIVFVITFAVKFKDNIETAGKGSLFNWKNPTTGSFATNYPEKSSSLPGRKTIPPQSAYPSPVKTNHPSDPSVHKKDIELSNTIIRISRIYEQPLTEFYVYHNNVPIYGWESLKKAHNYLKIQSILRNYRIQHTYMGNDLFVCVDMAMDVWNLLTTAGIRAKLMIGNVETDIAAGYTIREYLSRMNHAWVLAEVSPSLWIPLETTGGYVVEPSKHNFSLYNMGTMFDNPKGFKEFNTSRKAVFETCNETAALTDTFNRQFAGKPITMESTEYTGRIKQKFDDCELLLEKTTSLLRQRW